MDQLAKDLSMALEESENNRVVSNDSGSKWGLRRRTRSAGNLYLYMKKSEHNLSDDSSSSTSEVKVERQNNKMVSFHQSDSDDMSFSITVTKALNQRTLRMKYPLQRGVSHSMESDSVNEHSPAGPYLRRKRKLKRMSIDETPIPHCGKRKRSQRLDIVDTERSYRHCTRIKPLHQSIIDRIETFCYPSSDMDNSSSMEIQSFDESCEVASESSISWSGGEGHEGDDELTDWAPSMENSSFIDQAAITDADPREIRAGCRRLREERPGFSISTSANDKVARFLRDSSKSELRLYGAERDKLGQLADLYSLDLWFESPSSSLLRKTRSTPSMQPKQRHQSGLNSVHKKIRTNEHYVVS